MEDGQYCNFKARNKKTNDDMSGLTQNTLARIDKWLSYGTSIETAFPKLEQRYRMQICSEFYKRWVQNKDIDPRTVCRNIARRDYEMFFNQAAQSNKEAQEYVLALKITLDDEGNICPRTVTELNNDVLVCNHLSMFDPMAAMALLRKKGLVFITKKENISSPVGGPLITAMGCPVLDRGDSRMAVRLMQQVARRMSAGEAIGVYPEGTRSKTGLLGDFKPGAFKCALWGKVPVVVAVIEGSEQVHKRFFFRSTHIRMRILEVLPCETLRTMDTGAISRQARAIMIEEGGLRAA